MARGKHSEAEIIGEPGDSHQVPHNASSALEEKATDHGMTPPTSPLLLHNPSNRRSSRILRHNPRAHPLQKRSRKG